MKIAITGATGQLGRIVVDKLKSRTASENILALVRSLDKGQDLGVELREANYDDADSVKTALAGVDTLLLISGNEIGKRAPQHQNVIDAAKAVGVKWIVYTSLLHADKSTLSLAPEHAATEEALKASGLAYTILRNGWYTENYTNSIGGALQAGAFIGGAGNGKISSAARADFAEAAVTVLTTDGHQGKTYELAGDDAYTLTELAAELSRQSGKDIPYNNLPEETYASILAGFGLPEFFAQAIASWDTGASKGDLFNSDRQLSALIGRPTTPLAATIADTLSAVKES